jgi:hypothetical protein
VRLLFATRKLTGTIAASCTQLWRHEDGDLGIGVLPQREEILIGRLGFGGVALHGIGARQAQARQRAERAVDHYAPTIEKLPELGCSRSSLAQQQIRLAARIDGVHHCADHGIGVRVPQLVGSCDLKYLDSFRRILAIDFDGGANRGEKVAAASFLACLSVSRAVGATRSGSLPEV